TPRTVGVSWDLFRAKMETGLTVGDSPDLSRTGRLQPSHDVAFEVTATRRDGSPKLDLPREQRWRGASFTEYYSPRGRWGRPEHPEEHRIISTLADTLPSATLQWPDLGPDSYQLDFRLISRTGGPVFADPVIFKTGARAPIAVVLRNGYGYAWQNW